MILEQSQNLRLPLRNINGKLPLLDIVGTPNLLLNRHIFKAVHNVPSSLQLDFLRLLPNSSSSIRMQGQVCPRQADPEAPPPHFFMAHEQRAEYGSPE